MYVTNVNIIHTKLHMDCFSTEVCGQLGTQLLLVPSTSLRWRRLIENSDGIGLQVDKSVLLVSSIPGI